MHEMRIVTAFEAKSRPKVSRFDIPLFAYLFIDLYKYWFTQIYDWQGGI